MANSSGTIGLRTATRSSTLARRGVFFEVTPKGDIVWEYWSPYSGEPSLPHHEFLVEDNEPYLYAVFRALKLPPDHPGLAGRDLTPLDPQPPAIPHVVPGD